MKIKIVNSSDLSEFNTWSAEFFINVDQEILDKVKEMWNEECKKKIIELRQWEYSYYVDELINSVISYKSGEYLILYASYLQWLKNAWVNDFSELTNKVDLFRQMQAEINQIFKRKD